MCFASAAISSQRFHAAVTAICFIRTATLCILLRMSVASSQNSIQRARAPAISRRIILPKARCTANRCRWRSSTNSDHASKPWYIVFLSIFIRMRCMTRLRRASSAASLARSAVASSQTAYHTSHAPTNCRLVMRANERLSRFFNAICSCTISSHRAKAAATCRFIILPRARFTR